MATLPQAKTNPEPKKAPVRVREQIRCRQANNGKLYLGHNVEDFRRKLAECKLAMIDYMNDL